MFAFTDTQWTMVVALAAFYLVLCTRTALAMRRSGRSFWIWLVITIFTTSVVATMVMMRDQRRGYCPANLRDEDEAVSSGDCDDGDETVTCAKCGRTMRRSELRRISGKAKCPYCGQKFDKARPR